jgi:hypothetical protein
MATSLVWTSETTSQGTNRLLYTVPAGKTLVLKHLSVASLVAVTDELYVHVLASEDTGLNNTAKVLFWRLPIAPGENLSVPCDLFLEAGYRIEIRSQNAADAFVVSIDGYLVDTPVSPAPLMLYLGTSPVSSSTALLTATATGVVKTIVVVNTSTTTYMIYDLWRVPQGETQADGHKFIRSARLSPRSTEVHNLALVLQEGDKLHATASISVMVSGYRE